ncbi:MAG: FtsX-like permease family protein [Gemmatimonadaceae bacterium]
MLIAGRPYVLIGVAAAGFTGAEIDATDLWVPLAAEAGTGPIPWWRNPRANGFQILVRPSAGIGDGALEARITAGLRAPEALTRPRDSANVVRVGPIIRAQGPGTEPAELTIATRLAGVTIIVLVVACANVINLLLARAVRRRREIALRLAMGMTRSRLMRLLLTESAVLAMLAATAALLAAYWGGILLRGWFLPEVEWAASPLHWRVVALAGATGIGGGLVAGLLPAIQAAKTDLADALKAGAADYRAGGSGLRAVVIGVQSALSVVLLVGAGLFVRSLDNVRELRIGFDQPQRSMLGGAVQFDTRDSVRDARLPQVLADVAERLRRMRGVERVALARMAPKQEFGQLAFFPDVDTSRIPTPPAIYNAVSPEFFAATGTRVVRGEDFPRVAAGAMPAVVVVNEAMARAQWPGMEAVGRCLRFEPVGQCYRVIGVVETAIFDELLEKPQPQFYLPLDNPPPQVGRQFSWLIVRAQPRARQIAGIALQRALREAFPGGRPSVTTMEQLLEPEYRPWRLGATLFTAFGLLALIVAAVGIYSAISYAVAQRTREFGVRLALGARLHDILRSVIGGSLRPVAIGVAAGIALAVAAGRFVAALLYGIKPTDPGVILGVALVLLLVAAAAAFGPAWRASRVDPVRALRSE